MKKKISIILMFLFFVNVSVSALTLESETLEVIYKHIDKDSVVVFDIDHTIIENTIDLDSWIPLKIDELRKNGLTLEESVSFSLSMYFTLQQFVDSRIIGGSNDIIACLQEQKIPVIALTNRSIPVLKCTLKQMKKKGINFSATSLFNEDINLSVSHLGKFSEGIIFSGANDKGLMLFKFFDAIGYEPKKVIFIDDKSKYIESVNKEAENRNVEYVGIRLSLQDQKKENVNFPQIEADLYQLKTEIGMEPLS